jgi:ABC-2 type transport system ATP-binding protein
MSGNQAVTVSDLVVKYGDFKAVKGVSFEVSQGEIFGFLGANGAGKTTTIRVLCGLLPPSEGLVQVAGADPLKDPMLVKSRVGYMSQKFTLYRDLTISENLHFTGKLRALSNDRIESRVRELIEFIELDWPLNTMVRDLPAGVMQQVALVSATIHDPDIVFLDEPTAGVTPAARYRFWELIGKMSGAGKTVFVTTHYMDEAEQCNRVALMRAGELVALGSPEELKASSFPEPMFEITPSADAVDGWQGTLRSQDFLDELQTFGMRYHAVVKVPAEFEKYLKTNLPAFSHQRIKPSLEDVFIRVVEGKER